MDSNQKELLERVLLMMKYDSSKTLNENKKEIILISEQYSPTKGGFVGDGIGWKPSTSTGKRYSLVDEWPKGVDFPYVGEWVPNSDSRLSNPKTKPNFIKSKDGNGAFFIPLPYEPNEGEDYTLNFHRWDGKVYKDANGFYYIRMSEYKPDSNQRYTGTSKTGNYFDVFLRKNGKNLKYNPFEMRGSTIDGKTMSVKLSDTLLDKSGKLKDTKNLKNLLDSIDKPEIGIMDKWLKNPINSEFGKLINAWVNLIMSKNLDELLKLYDDVIKLGKGGNTRDLPNYGKGTTTFSSMILENEIYNRRAQNRKEGEPEPSKPEVVDGKTMYGIPQGYFVKSASELYSQNYENAPNSENVNKFRTWFNYFFPIKSKNPCGDGENLDENGPVNKYVICAANFIPKKIERTGLLINPLGGTTRPPSIENTNKKTAFSIFKENQNAKLSTEPKLSQELKLGLDPSVVMTMAKEEGLIGMYYDGDVQDLMGQLSLKNPEKYKFTDKDYESVEKAQEREIERKKTSSPEYIKKQKEEFYKWIITQTRVTNVYDTTWLECTIGVKNESECGETPYCGRAGKEFLEQIARGSLKTSNGKTVGSAYRDSSGNVKYYVPDVTSDGTPLDNQWDVPCTSDFWDDWGGWIQLGGMVAIAFISAGVGLGPTAAMILELAADSALNLYSLKKSMEAKDKDAIALDLAYVFLPFLMESAPVKSLLKSAKFGDEVIESVSSKLKSLPPNSTKTQIDDVIRNMTSEEQRVISQLGTEEYKDVVQKASKDVIDGLKKTSNASIGRKISNPLINILVYGAPAAVYLTRQVDKIDKMLKERKKYPLSQGERKIWSMSLSYLDNQDRDEFVNSLNNLSDKNLDEVLKNTKIKEAVQKQYYTETIKNEEDRKKSAEELIKEMRKIMEESVKKVEESNTEIELIVLDEPVIK